MTLPFSSLDDKALAALLKKHSIGLTTEEARKITTFLGRDPTLVEATIWGIQGSEHCSYKSSRRFLKNFPTTGKHVILGPGEDSGIVAITDGPPGKRWGLVIAHESHNHPSQIVPFEGAATGIGGVVRDVVCMGARVIGCMDMLRLGDLKTEETRTIAREVARGIAGYGNPLGIPNLGGDTVFDAAYNSSCLVNGVAIGIVREDEVIHSHAPKEAGTVGYDIILVGKPTDRSGFGGASFASATMEEGETEKNAGAVQEPNPFLERHLLASTYALFDWLVAENLLDKVSCKDLGAGGVVCASVEQVSDVGFGADVALDAVHIAIPDLPPEVIACAETQERLCFVVHPSLTQRVLRHYNETWDLPSVAENARASRIGTVNTSGVFRLTYKGEVVCEAKAQDITCGLLYTRPTAPLHVTYPEPQTTVDGDLLTVHSDGHAKSARFGEILKLLLGHPNGASTDPITVHYDKNVIGNTLIEPGEADAGVIQPLQDLQSYVHEGTHPGWEISEADRARGVAFAADGKGRYGRISPYWQGANAALETMRNVSAVGAIPRALTDCLNYGNPEIPEHLWALEQGIKGIAEASRGVGIDGAPVPIISGNVSLYNALPNGSSIDPTAIVACVGVLPDARKAITQRIPLPDLALYLLGDRRDECGGSLLFQVLEEAWDLPRDSLLGSHVPQPDFATAGTQMRFMIDAIAAGEITASHDISDGGLLLALFEMLLPQRGIGGTLGLEIDIAPCTNELTADRVLFSETGGYVLAVDPAQEKALLARAKKQGLILHCLGTSTASRHLRVRHADTMLVEEKLETLLSIWHGGLRDRW